MKKQCIPAVILFALSIVIAVGSQTFLSPCVHDDGTFGPCHWAGRAFMGLGCVLGAMAVLSLLIQCLRFRDRVRCIRHLDDLYRSIFRQTFDVLGDAVIEPFLLDFPCTNDLKFHKISPFFGASAQLHRLCRHIAVRDPQREVSVTYEIGFFQCPEYRSLCNLGKIVFLT